MVRREGVRHLEAASELAKEAEPGKVLPRKGLDPIVVEGVARAGHDAERVELVSTLAIGSPHRELRRGLSNQDNFNVFGFRVNPPDPVGDVGPNHYVEMINLVFAVYSKSGHPAARAGRHRHALGGLRGHRTAPTRRATRSWSTTSSRTAGSSRQFTTAGPGSTSNCVAISQTGDPTGAYYRYAFSTGVRTSRTTRSTGSGGTRTSSPRASSGRPSSTASASTRSRRTR